jgi:hypothetical protein
MIPAAGSGADQMLAAPGAPPRSTGSHRNTDRDCAMPDTNLPRTPFSGLSLEPLEGEVPAAPVTGRAVFTANTRSGGDRRKQEDRRQSIRYEPDRRKSPDRRPAKRDWDRGPR